MNSSANTFLDWATEADHGNSAAPRSLRTDNVQNVMRDIIRSFHKSEFLDRPLRSVQLAEADLNKLWHLEKDWNSYDASAPNSVAISNARDFVRELALYNMPYTKIVPSAEGGVAVALFVGEKRAVAEFLNDNSRDIMLYAKSGELSSIEPESETNEAYRLAILKFFSLPGEL